MRPDESNGKVWRKNGRNGRAGNMPARPRTVIRGADGNAYELTAAQAWLLTLRPAVPIVAQLHTGGVS